MNGAELAIVPETARVEPHKLAEFLIENKVTHLSLPAALAPYLPARNDYALKALICVGDRVEDQVLWDWSKIYPTFNGYGPTEASVCASLCQIKDGVPATIGSPLKHVSFSVGGKTGSELLIIGSGLAHGYLNDTEQTSRQFVSSEDNKIYYHTGDQVELDKSGEYRFVGRIDFQTKIRGARVETSAIETILKSIPGVDDAVVITSGSTSNDRFLVAFLATKHDAQAAIAASKALINAKLPSSHQPKLFKALGQLPYTLNHKVDRKALKSLVPKVEENGSAETTLEHVRAGFQQELNTEVVDDHQNFFHLGGDSIGAMRLLAKLTKATGKRAAVGDFRQNPTIAGMVALLENGGTEIIEVARNQRQSDILPLSYQQNAAWYMFSQDSRSKAYLAEATHHFEGTFDAGAMGKALQRIFDRHEIYRTVFVDVDGEPMQKKFCRNTKWIFRSWTAITSNPKVANSS